ACGSLGKLVELGSRLADPDKADLVNAIGQTIQVHGDLAAVWYGQFASLARRQGSSVGGQVGQRHVDLVADGGDDRQAGAGNRSRNHPLVERREVFGGPPPAGYDDELSLLDTIGQPDRGGDFLTSARALHPG